MIAICDEENVTDGFGARYGSIDPVYLSYMHPQVSQGRSRGGFLLVSP